MDDTKRNRRAARRAANREWWQARSRNEKIVIVAVVVVIVAGVAVASAFSKHNTSASAGTSASETATTSVLSSAAMDSYCGHLSSVHDTLTQVQNGTITDAELVDKLNSEQNNIHDDAQTTDDPAVAAKMQAVSDAIGRAKVAVDAGDTPDWNAVADAADQVSTCP